MTILQIHIVAASAWMGLIAAEVVIELSAQDNTTRRFVAEAHKRIDLFFEGPLVAIVLLTGCVLLYPLWPSATALLLLKVAVGIIAVVSNVVCFLDRLYDSVWSFGTRTRAIWRVVSWYGYINAGRSDELGTRCGLHT
jgi:hypothetical protein